MRCLKRVSRILWPIGLLYLNAVAVVAQTPARAFIKGRVLADSTGLPISGAEIELVGLVGTTRSDPAGAFRFSDVPAGLATLRVRHSQYRAGEQSVRVLPADTLELRIVLAPLAPRIPVLPAVATTATTDIGSSPLLSDFRRRRQGNTGKFLTRDDIEKIRSQSLVSVVQGHVGGFDLVRHPSGSGTAFASRHQGAPTLTKDRRSAANECYSNVWVNGQLQYYWSPVRGDPPRIEDFDLSRVVALEFYKSAADTPIELNAMSAACGTVVVWVDLKQP